LTLPCCFLNIDASQFGENSELDQPLSYFDAKLQRSIYWRKPVKPIFKGFIFIVSDPVVGEGILETTDHEQILFSKAGSIHARRKVLLEKGTRLYHLTTDLE
jgi:hypothetical protein